MPTPRLQVIAVVLFYMAAALIMVFVNKIVLNAAPNLPLLFVLFQSITTVLLLRLTGALSGRIEIPKLDLATARQLVPLLLVDASGFVFNTLCLRDVEAAFFQIARGMVLPLTIAVSSIHARTRPSLGVIISALLVTAGFFIGISPSESLPEHSVPKPVALLYGFISSLSIALHAVLIKYSLPIVHNSATQLSYWSNVGSATVLAILVLVNGEAHVFTTQLQSGTWDWRVFLWGNVVTGLFGFLISVAGILSVKVTSPVTHMFSSAARSVLQTLLGVRLFNDALTVQRCVSLGVIVSGTLFYTWVKAYYSDPTPSVATDIERGALTKPDHEKMELHPPSPVAPRDRSPSPRLSPRLE